MSKHGSGASNAVDLITVFLVQQLSKLSPLALVPSNVQNQNRPTQHIAIVVGRPVNGRERATSRPDLTPTATLFDAAVACQDSPNGADTALTRNNSTWQFFLRLGWFICFLQLILIYFFYQILTSFGKES